MNYQIEGGTLPVLRIQLNAGETVVSENGGRSWAKGKISTDNRMGSGGSAIGRMFSGESLFLSYYTAEEDAEIVFASSFPGSIMAKQLAPGETIICQKRSFLAASTDVELKAYVNGSLKKGLLGGEGFIMQQMTGPGIVFLEIDGHSVEYDLQAGERIVCDTGVLAVMDGSCSLDVEVVKGLKNKLFGGEGFFDTVITGPGKVCLQSMSVAKLAGLISGYIVK